MILIKLAAKSAWNRKISLSLAMVSIAISILLLLGVDTIRKQAKNSFINTISQTDLIVGARSGSVNLLLYSVFRIGNGILFFLRVFFKVVKFPSGSGGTGVTTMHL